MDEGASLTVTASFPEGLSSLGYTGTVPRTLDFPPGALPTRGDTVIIADLLRPNSDMPTPFVVTDRAFSFLGSEIIRIDISLELEDAQNPPRGRMG
ncbi:MAG: hypothetical protein ACXV4B_05835 [Halobacteriota archaeon]